jgi:O-antigen ligase
MGIIAALRETVVPLSVYLVLVIGILASLFWRAHVAIHLLAVFVAIPTLWYPIHSYPLGKEAIDLLFVSALIGILVNKGGLSKTPNTVVIFFMVMYTYLSLWLSALNYNLPFPISLANPFVTAWKNYSLLFFIFIVAYNAIKSESEIRGIINTILIVFTLISIQEIRAFVAGSSYSHGNRSDGPLWIVGLNSNHFAAYILYAWIFAVGMLITSAKSKRIFYLPPVVFGLYPLLFSYSRGEYVAAIPALVFYAFVKKRVLIIPILVFSVFWSELLPETVVERITMTENASGQIEESAGTRLEVWDFAKELFKGSPLLGIGFNGFVVASNHLPVHDTHNYYFKLLVEQGVIGTSLLAFFVVRSFIVAWGLSRSKSSVNSASIGISVSGVIVAILFCNIFGDRFSQLEVSATVMLMFAVVYRQRALCVPDATNFTKSV